MDKDELYELAKEKGYKIVRFPLPATRSLSVCKDGKCCIGLDTEIHGIEELIKLAHEYAHCETGTFYQEDSDWITKAKCEYKANKWMYQHLVPFEELLKAVHSGITNVWDLADYFGISQEIMEKAINNYFGRD